MLLRFKTALFSLLRATERYTKTDMVYFTTSGFWLAVGQVAASFASFLLAIAFANLLAPETYGTYKFVLSAVGILAIPTLGGINTALSQAIARGIEGSLKEGLYTRIRWGLAGMVAGFALSAYYFINGNEQLGFAFLAVAPFIPFSQPLGIYQIYLQAKRLFKTSVAYSIGQRLFYVPILVGVAFFFPILIPILVAYYASLTIINLIFLRRVLKSMPPNEDTESQTLRYGKHLSLTDIVGTVGSYLDSLLLFHYLGPVKVAEYAFARAPIDQILGLYNNVPAIATPRLANRNVRQIVSIFRMRIVQLFLVGGVVALLYAFIAPYVYTLLFPKYLASISFSQMLAVTLVLQLPLTFLSSVVESKLNALPVSWLYLRPVPQLVYIGSLLITIPLYGVWGAVGSRIVLSLARLSIQLGQWVVFARRAS